MFFVTSQACVLVNGYLQDHDSWGGGNGAGERTPIVVLFGKNTPCRRVRSPCHGVYACEKLDPILLDVQRHELNPELFQSVLQMQAADRISDGSTMEKKMVSYVLIFFASGLQ